MHGCCQTSRGQMFFEDRAFVCAHYDHYHYHCYGLNYQQTCQTYTCSGKKWNLFIWNQSLNLEFEIYNGRGWVGIIRYYPKINFPVWQNFHEMIHREYMQIDGCTTDEIHALLVQQPENRGVYLWKFNPLLFARLSYLGQKSDQNTVMDRSDLSTK